MRVILNRITRKDTKNGKKNCIGWKMKNEKQKQSGRLWLVVPLMVMLWSCGPNVYESQRNYHVIVPDSQSAKIIDPNIPFTVDRRSAIIDVGWYIELADLYFEVKAGKWEKVIE